MQQSGIILSVNIFLKFVQNITKQKFRWVRVHAGMPRETCECGVPVGQVCERVHVCQQASSLTSWQIGDP